MAQGEWIAEVPPAEVPKSPLLDAQSVEEAGEGVGLTGRRGVLWKRGAQVAEARGKSKEPLPHVSPCNHETLVEPAKDTVHEADRRSFPIRRVFDGATAGFQ